MHRQPITGPGVRLTPEQIAELRRADADNKALEAAQNDGAFDPASPSYHDNPASPYCSRPSDILLPPGWTWDRVEAARGQLDLTPDMVPIAAAEGYVAWGTINSVRALRDGK